MAEDDVFTNTYQFFHNYNKIILLLKKIGFEKKMETDVNIWYYNDYSFIFIHNLVGINGYYDNFYLYKNILAEDYHKEINKYKNIKVLSTSQDNFQNEIYQLSYFDVDIYYLIYDEKIVDKSDVIYSYLKNIFRSELRKNIIGKLYGN